MWAWGAAPTDWAEGLWEVGRTSAQEGVSRCAWRWRDRPLWLPQLPQLIGRLVFQNDRIPALRGILPLAFCCLRGKKRVSRLPSTALTSHLALPQLVLNVQDVTVIM